LARVWKLLVGRGIVASTPAGHRRLVEVVEAAAASAAGPATGLDP
jgi:hypothetical protein